jgi:hypothetical protein
MTIQTIAGCGLAIGLLTALSACAPGYYSGPPAYYARPAYQHAPSQSATRAQQRRDEQQSGSEWVNPEPAR